MFATQTEITLKVLSTIIIKFHRKISIKYHLTEDLSNLGLSSNVRIPQYNKAAKPITDF